MKRRNGDRKRSTVKKLFDFLSSFGVPNWRQVFIKLTLKWTLVEKDVAAFCSRGFVQDNVAS